MTALRFLCSAALAVAIAACSRQGDQPAAAPRDVAPFATMPPPADAAPASVVAVDPTARDAALATALLGSWAEPGDANDGFKVVTTYRADGTLSTVGTTKDTKVGPYSGTWSIAHGVLTSSLVMYGKAENSTADVLRLDADQFVYIDGDDKKTKIATRDTGPAPASAAAPPPVDEGTVFADETIFVAEKDTQVYAFTVKERAQLRLTVEIDEKVPVNIVFQQGKFSPEDYSIAVGMAQFSPVFNALDDEGKKHLTVDDIFDSPLSKRSAYGRYVSRWVTAPAGTYTVILDNSGEITPSRGDAPVHLRLDVRPLP